MATQDPAPDPFVALAEAMTADLERISADYPTWSIARLPAATLPCEARRHPYSMPPGGGIGWISAPTPSRLRELLDAVAQAEDERGSP